MVSGKVTVKNPTGLHLRPAGTLCKQAMQFKSSITFHYGDGNTANAKSGRDLGKNCKEKEQ